MAGPERRAGHPRAEHRRDPRRAGRPGADGDCRPRSAVHLVAIRLGGRARAPADERCRERAGRIPRELRRARHRDPPAAAPPARHHGRLGQRPGAARPDRCGSSPPKSSRRSARLIDARRRGARAVSRPRGCAPRRCNRTRLRVGEGLVGQIAANARPLASPTAQSHPDFAYRPETGEEIYHSLMGVPILRGGQVLGCPRRAEPHAAAIQPRTRSRCCRRSR